MEKNLNHLTAEEVNTLMHRYYAGETVSKLIEEYHISARPAELYKLFPPEVCQNHSCEYCHEFLVRDRPSKTWKNNCKYEWDLYCPVCGHKPFQKNCKCKNCVEKEQLLKIDQLKRIQEVYSRERTPVNFYKLSFQNKVFLGALCRALLKENLYEIKPYAEANIVLAPTIAFEHKIYSNLIHSEVISVSPNSQLEAFVTDSEDFPNTFYTFKASYYLNLIFPPDKHELFAEISNPNYYSPEYAEEALELWKEIAVAECIEYLQYQLKKVNFDFTPGDKTYTTFETILENFSVSQIYGIIWRSVADASKLYLERGITRKHAANSIIGACERYAERAKICGWDLSQYNRIKDLPESALSQFYFNKVLGIGEMGFRVPPTIV